MATIKLKNGSGAPLASDLVQGEPALDLTNKRLYTEDAGGAVIEVGVNPTELNVTNNIVVGGTVDGRDIATDGTKLDGIESGATADQTAAEIRTLVESATDSNVFTDADHTKLDGIEAGADVTDTTNVTAAGALMDSELTSEASVKALNQGVATTDSPTFAGLTTTADVSFGDNDKAIFGAGSDLQIYHSGTASFITENGTGDLRLSANNLLLRSDDAFVQSEDGTVNSARFNSATGVTLYRANAAKLSTTSTGILVTGSVTADGLTVDGSSAGRVTSAEFKNNLNAGGTEVAINLANQGGTNNADVNLVANRVGANFGSDFYIETSDGTDGTNRKRFNIGENGDISFYEDTGTTAKFFWDASTERLGIGNSAPATALDVTGTVTADGLTVDGAGAKDIRVGSTNGLGAKIFLDGSSNGDFAGGDFSVIQNSGTKFQILGGTPNAPIELQTHDGSGNKLRQNIASNGDISFYDTAGTTAKFFWDASAESLGIGTSPSARLHSAVGAVGSGTLAQAMFGYLGGSTHYLDANDIIFRNGSASETARIDSSGNVGIGTSSPDSKLVISEGASATGLEINPLDANERIDIYGFDRGSNVYRDLRFIADEFRVETGTSSATEAMRIDSSGNLLVGTTDKPSASVHGGTMISRDLDLEGNKTSTSLTTAATHFVFFNPNGAVGSISTNGSATAYNTSSDQRLKENIVDAPSASDDIDAIQVRSFDWKADGSHQKYGMIAQELQNVAPEAVSEGETEEDMMGVDFSKLVPMMLKEIQSLRARVAQLESN